MAVALPPELQPLTKLTGLEPVTHCLLTFYIRFSKTNSILYKALSITGKGKSHNYLIEYWVKSRLYKELKRANK